MPSERIQRRIDALLDEGNDDAATALKMAVPNGASVDVAARDPAGAAEAAALQTFGHPTAPSQPAPDAPASPESFGEGRFHVQRFLGEGGKKKVYLAHDTQQYRDVAFALIKTPR